MRLLLPLVLALSSLTFVHCAPPPSYGSQNCRCIPSDPCWPSQSQWRALNTTVEGRLIATVPLASPCHDPYYNQATCDALKAGWPYAQTHIPSSSSVISPLAQNHSCDPFSPRESPCSLGNYPVYAVNASDAKHVAAAVKFAKESNIRLIIKSSGHDLLGKSTGAGSLSIWMHSFKNISFTQSYSGLNTYNNYKGPAARIEPGLVSHEVYKAAHAAGVRVVGGTCNTVAVAGGYTQGGGHSLLSSSYGLSADNVLEWHVITACGEEVVATPSQNADLYWALSGGGPGVFAVVLSMTVKVYPDGIISGAGVTFTLASAPNEDTFWKAVEEFHKILPNWLDEGAGAPYVLALGTFSLQPLTLPGRNASETKALIEPFTTKLEELKVPYQLNITTFDSYLDLFATYYGPMPYGIYSHSQVQGSRLIPRSTVVNRTSELVSAYRKIWSLQGGKLWVLGNGNHVPSKPVTAPSNAVHPAWRNADIQQIVLQQWDWNATWAMNVAAQQVIENTVLPLLKNLSPGSGTYMNEGNPNQKDWKEAFYGPNYSKLMTIKKKWDPNNVFYAKTGVGSDAWVQDTSGRLCPV